MAGFALKVKSKSGQQVIKHLNPQSTVAELKSVLSNLTDVHLGHLHVLFGFPPKAMDLSGDNRTLVDVGISSGDTLIVDEKVPTEKPSASPSSVNNDKDYFASKGILMKKVVPSDNSCLFTSIGFVLNGKVDTTVGTFMRQIIAEVVAGDTTNYSEAFLGKPNPEYCEWIQKPNSWGGAIEVSVLSRFYGLEMDVVDTLNAIINRFGEDQDYGQRVFLLFDGIHYDPLFLENAEGVIKTLFPIEDLDIYNEAEQLARDMKSSRSNTITYNYYT